MKPILGEAFVVNGVFKVFSDPPSRRKKFTVWFEEDNPGEMLSRVPDNVDVKVEWASCLFPAPITGVVAWMIYAEMLQWVVYTVEEETIIGSVDDGGEVGDGYGRRRSDGGSGKGGRWEPWTI